MREEIALTAALPIPVLLRGESGTGKELVARAIHAASPRAAQPYVSINMAALNPQTAVAELFGHSLGSFTGAIQSREGYFREADQHVAAVVDVLQPLHDLLDHRDDDIVCHDISRRTRCSCSLDRLHRRQPVNTVAATTHHPPGQHATRSSTPSHSPTHYPPGDERGPDNAARATRGPPAWDTGGGAPGLARSRN